MLYVGVRVVGMDESVLGGYVPRREKEGVGGEGRKRQRAAGDGGMRGAKQAQAATADRAGMGVASLHHRALYRARCEASPARQSGDVS